MPRRPRPSSARAQQVAVSLIGTSPGTPPAAFSEYVAVRQNRRPNPQEAEITTDIEQYRRDGYLALDPLSPVEVLHAFYGQMQADFAAAGQSMRAFAAPGPLLRRDAIEIYAQQSLAMLELLWGLTPRIAAATGCELLQTYACIRLYQRNDVCRVHTDRHACEHRLSLTIAYGDDQPWPLSVGVEQPSDVVTEDFGGKPFGSAPMQPGDGVLYQGTHHRHGRVTPNLNN
jgi:hypothetical protein